MSEIIQSLSPKPFAALEALATYRFLTVSQFAKLGIGASEPAVRKNVLPKLHRSKKPLARKRKLGTFLPDVHYLTDHGAQYLAQSYKLPIENFPYPKGQVQFGEMFARHRFAQVDFHIGFRQWAEQNSQRDILFVDMDFDIIGSRRHGTFQKKTEIRLPNSDVPVVPDGIFGLMNGDQPMIFALEVHRTTQTKQVATQIKRYIEVLETGAVAQKYVLATSPIICSVHMRDNVLSGVKSALLNLPDFSPFSKAFIFNTFENVSQDVTSGWTFANDQPVHPFS